VGGTW